MSKSEKQLEKESERNRRILETAFCIFVEKDRTGEHGRNSGNRQAYLYHGRLH